MLIFFLISLFVFALYLFLVLRQIQHVPASLSETYYLIQPHGWLFTLMMWLISFSLLPAMLDVTPERWQFLAFLALASICFVGTAPNFKEAFEGKVHVVSAYAAALFGILWAVVAAHGFPVLIGVAFVLLLVAGLTRSVDSARTFWLEMIAFGTVYISTFVAII